MVCIQEENKIKRKKNTPIDMLSDKNKKLNKN
jgi:hypothetical protein